MKILSCYIAGFGKFSDQTFTFSDLTVIKEDNGWGKSTLAAFIRCMLFGMEAGRGKAVADNERAHYTPWQGGTYGGTLTFVCKNGQYRVERVFGKTPMQDVARVYDQNNMQRFEFGERAERLGERLFGVDADGYTHSAYIPQGEIKTGGVSEDMKTRLLALLSNGGNGETSAERAVKKLDEADKKIRAKRKPAKGKLDEIDERLDELARLKTDADNNLLLAKRLRDEAAQADRDILQCNAKLEELERNLELLSRRNELSVAKDMQTRLAAAKEELSTLRAFFGAHDPKALNLEGIQTAVKELYDLKARLRGMEERLSAPAFGEERALKEQIAVCEKTLASYDGILANGGERRKKQPKGKKIVPKVTRRMRWFLIASVLVSIVGAALATSAFTVGMALLGVGVVGMAFGFLWILPKRERIKPSEQEVETQDEISRLYDETHAELVRLQERLTALINNRGNGAEGLVDVSESEYAQCKEKISIKEQSIEKFLRNFAFKEIYDYRAAMETLRDNVARYTAAEREIENYETRLQGYSAEEIASFVDQPTGDVTALKAQKQAYNDKKEELLQERSNALGRAERMETQYDKAAILSEEGLLREEKARLEKRHRAILMAREILLKAKENMASRYLEPVERGCARYLSALGGKAPLRFTAEGKPVHEDGGAYRSLDYYSVGSQELVGLCIRVALADAVFQRELPTLILDDPFVNLDDMRTERAKAFVKELSKRYQIVYLTCKSERKL